MNPTTPLSAYIPSKEDLDQLHITLLELHKQLLEFEKRRYETLYGPIANPHEYLEIVMRHPAFQWLRSLSEIIVVIDEYNMSREQIPDENLQGVITSVQQLLTPDQDGDEFAQKYHLALQNDPAVTIAHGKVMQKLP